MADATPILEVRGLSKTYGERSPQITALRDVSFHVPAATWLAITGPSGAGKTTLLNLLAGLDRPTAGSVWVQGQELSTLAPDARTDFRRRHIGFVFQFFNLLPTMSAWDNVALPLLAERRPRREIAERTEAALASVGLGHRTAHRPAELSGGEQQRVGIARALVMRPRLLLADEPTGNLDRASGDTVLALLRRLIDQNGLAIVMATHSIRATEAADRMLTLEDGRLSEDPPPSDDERQAGADRRTTVRLGIDRARGQTNGSP